MLIAIGIAGLVVLFFSNPNLLSLIVGISLIVTIAFLYLPNFILIKNGQAFGFVGSLLLIIFFICIFSGRFSRSGTNQIIGSGFVLFDMLLAAGILGYALLLVQKNPMFKLYSGFAFGILALFLSIDVYSIVRFDTNITLLIIQRVVPLIYYWHL